MIKSLILKIRLWNPKYFINPFYSPSLTGIEMGKKMVRVMVEAIDSDLTFREELEKLINKHSLERHSNTPDFILAEYMAGCLHLFNKAVVSRRSWYSNEIMETKRLGNKDIQGRIK